MVMFAFRSLDTGSSRRLIGNLARRVRDHDVPGCGAQCMSRLRTAHRRRDVKSHIELENCLQAEQAEIAGAIDLSANALLDQNYWNSREEDHLPRNRSQ